MPACTTTARPADHGFKQNGVGGMWKQGVGGKFTSKAKAKPTIPDRTPSRMPQSPMMT